MSSLTSWTTVERAAEFLGLSTVTLRRTIERRARAMPDGSTIAQVDGITARKIGRLWRMTQPNPVATSPRDPPIRAREYHRAALP